MRANVLVTLSLLLGAACHHQKPDEIFGKERPAAAPVAAAPQKGSCNQDWECGSGHLCLNHRCVRITDQLAECKSSQVHFDFDASTLHPDESRTLERIARCLKADRTMQLLIDGNTDERGTLEYNLALGDRRARVVERYLRDLGVSEQQLSTVTYGKDRPLCEEHDERCWSENRRAGLQGKR